MPDSLACVCVSEGLVSKFNIIITMLTVLFTIYYTHVVHTFLKSIPLLDDAFIANNHSHSAHTKRSLIFEADHCSILIFI